MDQLINSGLSIFSLSNNDTIDNISIINACIKSQSLEIQFIPVTEIYRGHDGEYIYTFAYYLNYNLDHNLLVAGDFGFHGWDNKNSVYSFGIGENYLISIVEELN